MENYSLILKNYITYQTVTYAIYLVIVLIPIVGLLIIKDRSKLKYSIACIVILFSMFILSVAPATIDLVQEKYVCVENVTYSRYRSDSGRIIGVSGSVSISDGDNRYSLRLPKRSTELYPMGTFECNVVYAKHSKVLIAVEIVE